MAGCESCADCASYEFRPENIAPIYNNKSHFLRSQWPLPWAVYVGYRVGVAALMLAWILADFLEEAGKFYSENYAIWMIFATNWSFIMLGVSAVMHAILVVINFIKYNGVGPHQNKPEDSRRGLDVPMMIFWVVYNIAFNGAIVVTVSYWSFLVSVDKAGFLITAMSRTKHTLNTIYVLFDMMFSGVPVRIFHVVYPLFMGAIYTVFNVVYFTNNGVGPDGQPYAYYVMDWRNPLESALTCSIGFIFTTIMQCVMYGIYRLRLCLHGYLFNVRYDAIALENGDLLGGSDTCDSQDETDNILGRHRNRAASYSSVDNTDSDLGSPRHTAEVYRDHIDTPEHRVSEASTRDPGTDTPDLTTDSVLVTTADQAPESVLVSIEDRPTASALTVEATDIPRGPIIVKSVNIEQHGS